MTATLTPTPIFRGFDNLGLPLAGGLLTTYAAGTTNKQATYVDSTQTTQNTNPIQLNFRGECALWLDPTLSYKFVLTDAFGNQIPGYPVDNIQQPLATQNQLGIILNPRTAAEIAAGITPTNYGYAPGDVRRYGVVGDNSTNDTAAFQAALNAAADGGSLSATGGAVVTIPPGAILSIGNVTFPANVTVKGPQSFVGTMTSNSMSAPYHTMGGQISLASTATITMEAGSCIDGVLIAQHGLTFPQTGPSSYAGTAITVAGDDVSLKNSMIVGFNQAYSSSGFQRPHISHCLMDNNNGISISDSSDVGLIFDVHMWPFGTFYSGVTAANLQRSGVAYNLQGGGSASGASTDCIDCFCFGYDTGFSTGGTGDVGNVFLKCWSDNTANAYGTGYDVVTGATDTILLGCQASGNIQNYFFSNSAGLRTTVTSCNSWGATTHGLLCASGNASDIIVRGGLFHNNPNCFSYANSGGTGILDIDSVFVDSSNGVIYNISVSTTAVKIGQSINYSDIADGTNPIGTGTNVAVPTIASASSLALPLTGMHFIVSGTTSIGSINYGWAGRQVTLYFAGILTLGSSTGAYNNFRLAGNSNRNTVAGSILTLTHNGVQWYEIPSTT